MLKLINIIIFFFLNVAVCFANENIYFIENNEIFLDNEGDVLALRDKARKISFENAFDILTKNILNPEDIDKIDTISEIDISELVKDYKIQSEKITDINYFTEISVNFNPEKVKKFFLKNNIKINIFISENYVIFPIFKKFKTLYLFEDENYWYDFLLQEYNQQSLLKLSFPDKNHLNKLKIDAEEIINKNSQSMIKFLEFYKKKKAIIIFLEENFDFNQKLFSVNLSTTIFDGKFFKEVNILKKDSLPKDSNISQIELIAKIIMNELQNWWRYKIEDSMTETNKKKTIFITHNIFDLKKSIFIEERLKEILSNKNFLIYELTPESITYRVLTKYSLEQLNLALEVDNLKLKETDNENKFEILNY